MEVLAERLKDDKRRDAFSIYNHNIGYTVRIGTDPVLKFRWSLDKESWEFVPQRHYANTEEMLDPNEIVVRIPLEDSSKIPHKPWVENIHDPLIAEKVEQVFKMVQGLGEPRCAMSLKKALYALEVKAYRVPVEQRV